MNTKLDKKTLEKDCKEALEKGFKAVFLDITTKEAKESAKEMAKLFAEKAAPDLASAIEKFVKTGAVVNDGPPMMHTFTVTGASPAGPVTGTATGTLSQKYKVQ